MHDIRINAISPDSRSNIGINDRLRNYYIANNGVDLLIPVPMLNHTHGFAWFDLQLTNNARFFFDTTFTMQGRQILQRSERIVVPVDWPTFEPIAPVPPPPAPPPIEQDTEEDNNYNNGEDNEPTAPDSPDSNVTIQNIPSLILGEEVINQQGQGSFSVSDGVVLYPGNRLGLQFSHWELIPQEQVFISQFGTIEQSGIVLRTPHIRFNMPPVQLNIIAHWEPIDIGFVRADNVQLKNYPNLIFGELISYQQGQGRFNALDTVFLYPGYRRGYDFSHWFIEPSELVHILEIGTIDTLGRVINFPNIRFTMPPVPLNIY